MKLSSPQTRAPWTENLPGERARIVRLCARLTGSYDAAEDLAQETLYEAWRLSENLREAAAWRGFVIGIARNVCWRYLRVRGRDEARRVLGTGAGGGGRGPDDGETSEILDRFSAGDAFDLEAALEREERSDLLDRALGALAAPTRQLLVQKYVDELSQAEIAERYEINENAVGVRIHRARAALRRVVETTPELAEKAAAYGLVAPPAEQDSADVWQETRIWCPLCGRNRLEGRFDRTAGSAETADRPAFAVRCRECRHRLGFDFTTGHPQLDSRKLLHGVVGFKPILSRLSAWWNAYDENARIRRVAACPLCGRPCEVRMEAPPGADAVLAAVRGMYLRCDACDRTCATSASGLILHRPAAQAFWRQHPRIALADERDVVFAGRSAVVVRLESLTDTARLEVVLDRSDFSELCSG